MSATTVDSDTSDTSLDFDTTRDSDTNLDYDATANVALRDEGAGASQGDRLAGGAGSPSGTCDGSILPARHGSAGGVHSQAWSVSGISPGGRGAHAPLGEVGMAVVEAAYAEVSVVFFFLHKISF
ncbi:hypothetical protein T492DRAFT_41539 [Pavlovales sp. CCMP2436]|nr:hypothetical protein T492DRAFT_41539 [Pavlovales sp. CCMP2436]